MNEPDARAIPGAGLCATCGWARAVTSARGSTFLRCGRSDVDARFPKYPPLPVTRCAGYEPRDEPLDEPRPEPRAAGS